MTLIFTILTIFVIAAGIFTFLVIVSDNEEEKLKSVKSDKD